MDQCGSKQASSAWISVSAKKPLSPAMIRCSREQHFLQQAVCVAAWRVHQARHTKEAYRCHGSSRPQTWTCFRPTSDIVQTFSSLRDTAPPPAATAVRSSCRLWGRLARAAMHISDALAKLSREIPDALDLRKEKRGFRGRDLRGNSLARKFLTSLSVRAWPLGLLSGPVRRRRSVGQRRECRRHGARLGLSAGTGRR